MRYSFARRVTVAAMAARANPFPPLAVSWLAGELSRVLVVGGSTSLVATLCTTGHQVTVADRSLVQLQRSCGATGATPVAAAAEQLPFAPCQFDAVLLPQNFHTFAPGLALAEIARVLVPNGRIGVIYTTRDDTVPWVRRLAATLQSVDETAMRGDYGTESIEHLKESRYFPVVEQKSFRTWFPVTREGLVAMVAGRRSTQLLDEGTRTRLLADVAAHYDSMARAPEPLLLPYQATCWRARVSQDELSVPIVVEDGLRIL